MDDDRPPSAAERSYAAGPCRVRVCVGCCCGNPDTRPGVDHEGLVRRLQWWVGEERVLQTGCLLACDRSNVVVVMPATGARPRGGRPTWVSEVLTIDMADAVGSWAAAGGPGAVALPAGLSTLVFRPDAALDVHRPRSVQ